MSDSIPSAWADILSPALATPEARRLDAWLLAEEAAGKQIYPPRGQRLRALELTPLSQVKVVILGQDPYHGAGQAHGLSFSVRSGVKPPRSLANVFRELRDDLGIDRPAHGNLENWARAGVLLLNNLLTVEQGTPNGHKRRGWESITDALVAAVVARAQPAVFILWGGDAQEKASRIADLGAGTRHCLIASSHPSPLSARHSFFGSKPFSRANAFLEAQGRGSIDWSL